MPSAPCGAGGHPGRRLNIYTPIDGTSLAGVHHETSGELGDRLLAPQFGGHLTPHFPSQELDQRGQLPFLGSEESRIDKG